LENFRSGDVWILKKWISGLVELIKYKQKTSILCYYTIHGAQRMCPKNQFFQQTRYKICVPLKFGF